MPRATPAGLIAANTVSECPLHLPRPFICLFRKHEVLFYIPLLQLMISFLPLSTRYLPPSYLSSASICGACSTLASISRPFLVIGSPSASVLKQPLLKAAATVKPVGEASSKHVFFLFLGSVFFPAFNNFFCFITNRECCFSKSVCSVSLLADSVLYTISTPLFGFYTRSSRRTTSIFSNPSLSFSRFDANLVMITNNGAIFKRC